MKYELTDHDTDDGLRRIRALVDIPGVVDAGVYGGLVSDADNLAQVGRCWVSYNARVTLGARVADNAQVYGRAHVTGKAVVRGNAHILDNAFISGHVRVEGFAQVCEDAMLCQSAHLYGFALRTTDTLYYLDKGRSGPASPRRANYSPYKSRFKWY